MVSLLVTQEQDENSIYTFPLEVEVGLDSTTVKRFKFQIDKKVSNFQFDVNKKPTEIILDPDNWLLANIRKSNPPE